MPNFKIPILAKPSGVTLEQHKLNVVSEGMLLLEHRPFVAEKYEQRVGRSLSRRLKLVCQYHDDGKMNEKWQNACRKIMRHFWNGKKDTREHLGIILNRILIRLVRILDWPVCDMNDNLCY